MHSESLQQVAICNPPPPFFLKMFLLFLDGFGMISWQGHGFIQGQQDESA